MQKRLKEANNRSAYGSTEHGLGANAKHPESNQ